MDYTSSAAPSASSSLFYDLRHFLSFIFDYRYGICGPRNGLFIIHIGFCITFAVFARFLEHALRDHLVAWSHFVSINRKNFWDFPAAIASRTLHASKPLKFHFLNLDLLFIPFALTVGHDRVSNSGFGVISEWSFFF